MIFIEKDGITQALVKSLWLNWAVAFGAIALELLLPRLMSKTWLPFAVFLIAYFELVYLRSRQRSRFPRCVAMLRVSVKTLTWSAVVMLTINLMATRHMFDSLIHWNSGNVENPYVTALVVFPTMIVISLYTILRGYGSCVSDVYNNRSTESQPENGVVRTLFRREARHQVNLMLVLSTAFSVIGFWYYFVYYINVNMNTPDVFFFNWMPIGLYFFSLYFMWTRYQGVANVIGPMATVTRSKGNQLRFLVIHDDQIFLSRNQFGRWDTPAITYSGSFETLSDASLRRTFESVTGYRGGFEIKYLYDSGYPGLTTVVQNYAVFVESDKYPAATDMGEWLTLDKVDRLMRTAQMSAEMTDEMHRIYTITMAWKTYDTNGKRLYPIKNYRPTFRICDLRKWTVDYNDLSWLAIADNNQDRAFFNTRRLWRKLTGNKV